MYLYYLMILCMGDVVSRINIDSKMEFIAHSLQDYKELVGNTAAIVTIAQFFSPAFLCNDIRKQGNTRGIPIMPFLGGIVIGLLNLQYGFLLRDDTMIRVSFAGVFLNILYLVCYYVYAENKGTVWLQMGAGGAFSAAVISYTIVEVPEVAENRLGILVTVLMMVLIASPLFELPKIIKTKSTEGMPFPIIFSGTIVTFLWLLYGIILRNEFIVFQNVVGFGLSAVQLVLMAIYPSKPKPDLKKKSSKKTN